MVFPTQQKNLFPSLGGGDEGEGEKRGGTLTTHEHLGSIALHHEVKIQDHIVTI
jgi:hypothetical protein